METDELLREVMRLLWAPAPQAGVFVPVGSAAEREDARERELTEQISRLTAGLDQLRLTTEVQTGELATNTQALEKNTLAKGSDAGSTAKGIASSIFSPVLRYSPVTALITGIGKLFGGSKPEAPPLLPYVPPPAIRYEGTLGAAGAVRLTDSTIPTPVATAPAVPPTIQVQVQAIDSRSFLDHSDAIASALREALLRSHPVGDVLREA